ncbi:DUF5677 domain-containing protein [Bacillus sp. REN16]|uniref:DUF5677 domain-containing protein n=1 Tax=Bacillus sp. REN16 TaxID=2887296 RepID=UPI001E5231BA|nr:DUF5677 domain-containing protein [Bacillus sp. REN16]MCC3358189.1 DUF5677 domain-containing protein [Bacillus sp. REN16]
MDARGRSRLSDHKYKKGKIISPMNSMLGDKLLLNSWTTERLPEYIWLGLILLNYDRKKGLEIGQKILYLMSKLELDFSKPKISLITNANEQQQKEIYKIISSLVEPNVLAPMTIILRDEEYKLFNEFFYDKKLTVDNRLSIIKDAVEKFYDPQSDITTDLRYLAICLPLFKGEIKIFEGLKGIDAIKNYSMCNHDDDEMKLYRPSIRSFEGFDHEKKNDSFISYFWTELGMITDCKPMFIDFSKSNTDVGIFIIDTKDAFQQLMLENKESQLDSAKFKVLIGSTIYMIKIIEELIEKELENSILGRHGFRTILEVYIMIKYLIKNENTNPNIFSDYQIYGVGKYKHVLLRVRESSIINEYSHIELPILHGIVNEPMLEEFLDIDVRYFDTQSIKKKFELVDENELYETYYEYDNNFVHGFWGAIRESSMIFCENPLHKYHTIPDIDNFQKLPSVVYDTEKVFKKHIEMLSCQFEMPDWYKQKYKELNYGI